jgi:glutathione S-transferase
MLPADPVARARGRFLELKSDTDIDAGVIVLATLKLFRPELVEKVPEALPMAEEVLAAHHAFLERELAGREWFLGSFSLVDIALAPHLASAAFIGYPVPPEFPELLAWSERVGERPSVKRAIREMAEGYAASQNQPDSLFDTQRLHWRNDRIEALLRCGLGGWLVDEFAADRAFLSPLA